jgi:Replication-relaxation
VPTRVLSEILDGTSPSTIHRQLRRFQQTGFAQPVRVPSSTAGGRPLALWQLTPEGRAVLTGAAWPRRERRLPRQWPRLLATYELVGAMAAALSTDSCRFTLQAWEAPSRRSLPARSGGRSLELPAAAVLGIPGTDATQHVRLLLLPDLGWTSVTLHRGLIAGLVALRAAQAREPFPTLVVATVAAPGRAEAWRELLARVAAEQGEMPLASVVVTWPEVRRRQLVAALRSSTGSEPAYSCMPRAANVAAVATRWPEMDAGTSPVSERILLQLVGRHPFLPLAYVAAVVGTRIREARARLDRLAKAGLVRWVDELEAGDLRLGLAPGELAALELSELTREGLRELAASFGLSLASAERLHGLAGGGPERPTRTRLPLVRTMAHTLGADAVFVALHVALSKTAGNALVRWDNAAAAMRGRCRPDGYGVCRVGGRHIGFFLEYDRGTESARDYAAKWAAYYAYRDSGRAAADYASFPTILVVTGGSEERVLRSAGAGLVVRPASALPILATTTGWITGHAQGMLGPIWRTPDSSARRLWVAGGAAGQLQAPSQGWLTAARAGNRIENIRRVEDGMAERVAHRSGLN